MLSARSECDRYETTENMQAHRRDPTMSPDTNSTPALRSTPRSCIFANASWARWDTSAKVAAFRAYLNSRSIIASLVRMSGGLTLIRSTLQYDPWTDSKAASKSDDGDPSSFEVGSDIERFFGVADTMMGTRLGGHRWGSTSSSSRTAVAHASSRTGLKLLKLPYLLNVECCTW